MSTAANLCFSPGRLACLLAATVLVAGAQPRDRASSNDIDVEHYTIEAEINPRTQTLAANVEMRLVPVDDRITNLSLELHNGLNVAAVTDGAGRQIPTSRSQQDFSLRLSFPDALVKGTPVTLKFRYDGRLTGTEDGPIWGIRFASIQNDHAYLLYPARWFPVNGYQTDRYTADLRITVPAGYRVLSGGLEQQEPAGDKTTFVYQFTSPSFPGSIGVVQGAPVKVSSQGVTSNIFFRKAASLANGYGEEIGKILSYESSVFGIAPYASLYVMETEDEAPNGYSSPGILFLSPKAMGADVNARLLSNMIARQWWTGLVSPVTRNHNWIVNGMARYAEILYQEHVNGPAALDNETRDVYIEALTVEEPPLIQSARLEDYSPEYWAATAGKGAAVMNMLRFVVDGDSFSKGLNESHNFVKALKEITERYAWKSISTDDFRQVFERVSGQNLQGFFIQWIESRGAPEFMPEYTVFRTGKGFRVMGKISQDLDTFRMPVDVQIETEGNPEEQRVEVVGTASEFVIETFGKPKKVTIDPHNRVLRYSDPVRVLVAIRRGEQFFEIGEFAEALKEYQKALDVNRASSLAHYRVAEIFFFQGSFQSAANEFREALNGDLEPKWTEVWSHISLGQIFDITAQRERAVNEYNLAIRTKDNTQGALEVAAKYLKEPYQRQRSSN